LLSKWFFSETYISDIPLHHNPFPRLIIHNYLISKIPNLPLIRLLLVQEIKLFFHWVLLNQSSEFLMRLKINTEVKRRVNLASLLNGVQGNSIPIDEKLLVVCFYMRFLVL